MGNARAADSAGPALHGGSPGTGMGLSPTKPCLGSRGSSWPTAAAQGALWDPSGMRAWSRVNVVGKRGCARRAAGMGQIGISVGSVLFQTLQGEPRMREWGPSVQKSMHRDGVIPVLSSPGHHPRGGIGIIPISSTMELLCACPSLPGAELVALRCPPLGVPPSALLFLGASVPRSGSLSVFIFHAHLWGTAQI